MSRLPGFALTFLSVLLTSLPAMAGQLVNWNFNASQNRFTFYTNSRVQPTAQLIPNPTRIVVDLPGTTLSGPTVRQAGAGRVREIRIGEPDSFTTRVVIELEAGYTVDPQQVKVRGITPTQWVVELPTPELAPASNNNVPAPNPDGSALPAQNLSAANPPNASSAGQQYLQVTDNGLFVRLDKNGDNSNIRIQPNARQSTVNFDLTGAVLPESLVGQSLPVGQYGVEEIKFSDNPNNPRLSLALADSGGGWNAYYSRVGGGVVLLPKQISRSGGSNPAPGSAAVPVSNNTSNSSSGNRSPNDRLVSQASNRNLPNITAIEVTRDDSQLIIRGDRQISARGNFNRLTGNYEIRLDRAQLSPQFQSPELATGGPIYQLNIRQETNDSVLILVQPNTGRRFGRLFRSGGSLYALELIPDATASRPTGNLPANNLPRGNSGDQISIAVQPPPANAAPSFPPEWSSPPAGNLPSVPRGGRLVVVDPGHGGKDPGAIGIRGVQEKDIVLAVSQYLQRYLEQQGVRVLMTRTGDYFISLQGRTDMANRAGADLFVSIHANSMGMGRPDVNGFEIYYHGNAGLSQAIHRNVVNSLNVRDRRVRQARFYVLRNSRMPSTLVEMGFVTGNEDNYKLTDPNFQQQMAQAIARGVLEYLQQR